MDIVEAIKAPRWRRSTSWTDDGQFIYGELRESPLHDLMPIAQPGLLSRVTKYGSVGKSLHALGKPFQLKPGMEDIDDIDGDDSMVKLEQKFTHPLICAAAIGVLPAFQYGFNNGDMNTAAVPMRASLGIPVGGLPFNDSVWGFCVSVFCLGALIGCTTGASLAELHGRRCALLVSSAAFVVGSLLQVISAWTSFGILTMIAGRTVSGMAAGSTTVVVPMYLGEISPPHLRGTLGTTFQLTCVIAMLVAQVLGFPSLLGTEQLWPVYVALVALPGIIIFACQGYLVESPRWLISQGSHKNEAAREAIAQLHAVAIDNSGVQLELEMLKETIEGGNRTKPKAEKNGFAQLLKSRSSRPGLVICVCCSVVQQFSGINNAFNYSSTFLSQNGMSPDTVMAVAILMNLGNVVVSLLSGVLMDRAGRRTLLLISASGMFLSILALTTALANPGQVWTQLLAVVSVVSYVTSFGFGMGPVPWLLPAELFAMEHCGRGTAVAASSNWLANFIVGQVFLPMSSILGQFCFLPFAAILLAFLVFAFKVMPETRGKTLEQILDQMNSQRRPMPNKTSAAPLLGSESYLGA